MAQWNHDESTLHLKLVYYGPSLGGKTTTLEALHEILDPRGANELVSIENDERRTLLFDLLHFEPGELCGYRVSMGIFTVPGQVPYDTTRRVVLREADALVFVADSRPSRREQNVWSLQNLRMNMRAQGLDAEAMPVVFQFNKQDLDEAAPAEQVAAWLGIDPGRGFASSAVEVRGVLEPFAAACSAMVEGLSASADGGAPAEFEGPEPARQLDGLLAGYAGRGRRGKPNKAARAAKETITLCGDDLLECSVRASVALAERLSARRPGDTRDEPVAVAAGAARGRR